MQAQSFKQIETPLDYQTYMGLVLKQNLSYAAEKLNISISEAEIKAAKVFNDPQLSFEYANNDDRRMQMGQGVSAEISKTFSPGKRNARIDLAKSEKALNEALLESYFHNLRMESTLAYLEALKQGELFRVKQNAYENIRKFAKGDSIKFALGKIMKVDAVQSNLEAGMIQNQLVQALTELHNAYSSLQLWSGSFSADSLYIPGGSLQFDIRQFNINYLLQTALDNRAYLVAAMKNVDVANKSLKIAKRERNIDFDIALGYNYNTEVLNIDAPAPKFNGITAGISIPLKFSNLNRGSVQSAQYKVQEAEINYRQAQLEVQISVMQNLRQYLSLVDQVSRFDNGLLNDAKLVLDGKMYSYDRGETSLLEVLDAQRTYDELRTAYIETLYNCAAALAILEQSAGIWDIVI